MSESTSTPRFHRGGADGGGILPPYSGEETTCTKCSHGEAYTRHQPSLAPGQLIRDDSDRLRRGPLPERLRRECKNCDFTWDEDLCPPGCGMTVEALAHALAHATPFPMEIPTKAHHYTAERLLTMLQVTARPDHPVWQYDAGRPAPETTGICEVVHPTTAEEEECERRRSPQPESRPADDEATT